MLWVRNALRAHNMPSWTPVLFPVYNLKIKGLKGN